MVLVCVYVYDGTCACWYMLVHVYVAGTCTCISWYVYIYMLVHVYVGIRWYMYVLVCVSVHVGACVDNCEETGGRGKLIKSMTPFVINW